MIVYLKQTQIDRGQGARIPAGRWAILRYQPERSGVRRATLSSRTAPGGRQAREFPGFSLHAGFGRREHVDAGGLFRKRVNPLCETESRKIQDSHGPGGAAFRQGIDVCGTVSGIRSGSAARLGNTSARLDAAQSHQLRARLLQRYGGRYQCQVSMEGNSRGSRASHGTAVRGVFRGCCEAVWSRNGRSRWTQSRGTAEPERSWTANVLQVLRSDRVDWTAQTDCAACGLLLLPARGA